MADELAFQTALDDDPNDSGIRLLFGDWLAARGDDRWNGYVWMGRHHKRPLYVERLWKWWTIGMKGTPSAVAPGIGRYLTQYIEQSSTRCYHFTTRRIAEEALCRALEHADLDASYEATHEETPKEA